MSVPDGVVLMYVKNGTVYPVALTNEQNQMLPYALKILSLDDSLRVLSDYPIGEAINLKDEVNRS